MPGFDGTGPTGLGPMTGRGMGYCAVKFPQFGNLISGYSGIQGVPANVAYPAFINPYYLPVRPLYRSARYGEVVEGVVSLVIISSIFKDTERHEGLEDSLRRVYFLYLRVPVIITRR